MDSDEEAKADNRLGEVSKPQKRGKKEQRIQKPKTTTFLKSCGYNFAVFNSKLLKNIF